MNILSSCLFFLLTLLSLLTCHASEITPLPDNESQNVLTPHDTPRGFRGIMQLRESKSVPSEILVQPSSEETGSRIFSSNPVTPNSLKISFPPLPSFLKQGDTIMVLEDTESSRKILVNRLKRLGFNVIDAVYGFEALDRASDAAKNGIKIPLFLFDFNVPFKADEIAVRLSCGQTQLNGGEAARHIKQIMIGDKKPFESSVFVCLTGTPEDVLGYEDVFWQIRDKLTEPNAEIFLQEVRQQLIISEVALIVVPNALKRGTQRIISRPATQPTTPDIEDGAN